MNLIETFRVALGALASNRLRVLLTTLGIMIGVASVVSLTSLGGSLQAYITGQFESLGADVLTISAARGRFTATGTQPLTTVEAEGIGAASPHVSMVAWSYSVQGTVSNGANTSSPSILGVTANYAALNEWFPADSASFITARQLEESARVTLLDQDTAEDLFEEANPVGQTILINGQVFTVIGVMEERSTSGFGQQSTILIPLTTAQTRLANVRVAGNGFRVTTIQAKAISSESEDIEAAEEEVEAYLLRAHGIANAAAADFTISSAASTLESLSSTLSLVTLFLSVVAGISLLVGGIGVMNIMLVSVTERTREIGLRKAVGAQSGTILTQFLLESILLALLGGVIGIALGALILVLAGQVVPQFAIALTPESALLATGISSLIGIISGMYPASRAANMPPIQALRFE